MAKNLIKSSDRGRNSPEPGDPPGSRASQRSTEEQLAAPEPSAVSDPAVEWERSEQDKLPPRGQGSQQNQGEERGPMIGEGATGPADVGGSVATGAPAPGLQSGGTRGPSNQNRG